MRKREKERLRVESRAPVGTLREGGLEGVGAGALDNADERPGVENDLQILDSVMVVVRHSNFRLGGHLWSQVVNDIPR